MKDYLGNEMIQGDYCLVPVLNNNDKTYKFNIVYFHHKANEKGIFAHYAHVVSDIKLSHNPDALTTRVMPTKMIDLDAYAREYNKKLDSRVSIEPMYQYTACEKCAYMVQSAEFLPCLKCPYKHLKEGT